MSAHIKDLYSDEKFESIIYYLQEHGFLLAESLNSFDFDELFFIPGVSADAAMEAKKIYIEYLAALNVTPDVTSAFGEGEVEVDNQYYNEENVDEKRTDNFKTQISDALDAQIADVYFGVPRSEKFIEYCHSKEKMLMSQLDKDDFINALSLKGMGAQSVEKLEKIYSNFWTTPALCSITKVPNSSDILTGGTFDTPIENIFRTIMHGKMFIRHCQSIGIYNAEQLLDFSFDHRTVDGVGKASMEKLQRAYLDALQQMSNNTPRSFRSLNEIPSANRKLELRFLSNYNISSSTIQILSGNGYRSIGDISENEITPYCYALISSALTRLKSPLCKDFVELIDHLNEKHRACIVGRSQGETLQKIADDLDLTRERVRQIESKVAENLRPTADMIANTLLFPDKISFPIADLAALFENQVYAECCRLILKESDEVIYLKYSNKFVRKSRLPKDYMAVLKQFSDDIIGEGLNFYDNIENIESQLPQYGLEALDVEDIMNYLVQLGYQFFGDFVKKRAASYALICRDAIVKFFPDGIKLDNDETNEDMKRLRDVISRHYQGLVLPGNNRALTSRITTQLILSGRGKYCAIESVVYNASLFSEVYQFISESPEPSLYYSEIFTHFQGRFLAETNVSNRDFLHGMLMHLYPDDFRYERDMLVKLGERRRNVDERICELIIERKGPVSKKEIKSAIPGLNDFVIAFVVDRTPKLIYWEYNTLNHIDNVSITENDLRTLDNILQKESAKKLGYLSDTLFYRAVQYVLPEFIEKNGVTNKLNLFFIAEYCLGGKYVFQRPHIATQDFSKDKPKLAEIAKVLLGCDVGINYLDFLHLSEQLGWADAAVYNSFAALAKDCIRISENDYVFKNCFELDSQMLMLVKHQISLLIKDAGYFAVNCIFNFDSFPQCSYEWNSYLVESIIAEFDIGFKLIAPQIADRRYQRGIILPSTSLIDSFDKMVAEMMKQDGIDSLSETEMERYLKNKGLIIRVIPQELYDCPWLSFKDEVFTLKLPKQVRVQQ